MSESIYTFIRENQQANDWLYRHSLSARLKSAKASVEDMVRKEAKSDVCVDPELQSYCGDFAQVTNDLQTLQTIRVKEQEAKQGQICLIIAVVIVIGLIIWAIV